MQMLEQKGQPEGVIFARVDADVEGLIDQAADGEALDQPALEKLFREALDNEDATVKVSALSDKELPLMLLENEQLRRYREMAALYGQDFKLPERPEIVVNSACAAVKTLCGMQDQDLQKLLAKQYYDIARMSARPLENEELTAFIRQSYEIAKRLAEKA